MMALSLGRRASNSSATRGRPPVMSPVLAEAIGLRLRVLLGLVTLLGGAFGVAMLLAASRQGAPRVAPGGGMG